MKKLRPRKVNDFAQITNWRNGTKVGFSGELRLDAFCSLLPPIGVRKKEQASLSLLQKRAPCSHSGRGALGILACFLCQLPLPFVSLPSHPTRSSGSLIAPVYGLITRIQELEQWVPGPAGPVVPGLLDMLRGLFFSAQWLVTCPLSSRCSPGRGPEIELSTNPHVCLHRSASLLHNRACFLLLDRSRILVASLGHCEIETRSWVRRSENVHVPRFPFCFCWQCQQWLKYWLLSCPAPWQGP